MPLVNEDEAQRKQILKEILDTETRYLDRLETITDVCMMVCNRFFTILVVQKTLGGPDPKVGYRDCLPECGRAAAAE